MRPPRPPRPGDGGQARRRPRFGLRVRATIGFGVTALFVAVVLAAITFGLARAYLVDQRQDAAEQQTYVNARLARTVLRTPDPDIPGLLGSLGGGTASNPVLRFRGEWFSTSVTSGPDAIPQDLMRVVSDGRAGHQRYRDGGGALRLAVGVPIAATDGSYFELFALDAPLEVPPVGASPPQTRAAVVAAMAGHVRGKAVYSGLFKRPSS